MQKVNLQSATGGETLALRPERDVRLVGMRLGALSSPFSRKCSERVTLASPRAWKGRQPLRGQGGSVEIAEHSSKLHRFLARKDTPSILLEDYAT